MKRFEDLTLEEIKMLEFTDETIRQYDDGEDTEGFVSYAIVWWLGDDSVIAEPYGYWITGGTWFYNRTTQFAVL